MLLAETLSLMTYVNADLIAQGLSGFDPEKTAIQAGRIMVQRLRELASQRASFAFETTLAARSFAPWLRELQRDGYRLHLEYFWLASPELAVARVAERVRSGGHDVPEATIRQRYIRSLDNFFTIYGPLVDTWRMHDNSGPEPARLIASKLQDGGESIVDAALWTALRGEKSP
jgi:predicted ABC-type ATPase